MGYIKSTPQTDQNGQETGNIALEITYGGKEAPFGGIDASKPPAYIDPNCFASADGFLVIDGQLVAASWQPYTAVPTLWNGVGGVNFLKAGTYYDTKYGQLNYALGYSSVAVPAVDMTPSGVAYTYYMTTWIPGSPSISFTDTLSFTIFNSSVAANNASITLGLLTNGDEGAAFDGIGASFAITGIGNIVVGPSGVTETIPGVITSFTVSGGSGYTATAGENIYYINQLHSDGTINITAQLKVTAVDANGAITAASLVPDSYTVSFDGTNYPCTGLFYSTGSAQLVHTSPTIDVTLQVAGPGGTNAYTVAIPSVQPSSGTTGAGTGAVILLTTSSGGGYLLQVRGTGGTGYTANTFYQVIAPSGSGGVIYVPAVGPNGSLLGNGIYTLNSGSGYINNATTNVTLAPLDVETILTLPVDILNTMAAEINGTTAAYAFPDPNVSASVNTVAETITLTANVGGTVGNSITVQDLSELVSDHTNYYYYFPCRTPENLSGGTDSTGTSVPLIIPPNASPISIADVGGVLYIANIGPAIIKYGGPGIFLISSTYQGARVLRKFAGSLIGLGLTPAPGTVIQSLDMIFSWSAAGELDVWNPLTAGGNITGAGFAQLADIADYLVGLIVANNTAYIIRSQGLSYATALSNGSDPFQFQHITLDDEGEGASNVALITQYGGAGYFVGNSDIYAVSSSISAIGTKIYPLFAALLNALSASVTNLSSNSCSPFIGGSKPRLSAFGIDTTTFIYESGSNTWMMFTIYTQSSQGISSPGRTRFGNPTLPTLVPRNPGLRPPPINGPTLTFFIEESSQLCTLADTPGGLTITAPQATLMALAINQNAGVPSFYTLEEGVVNVNSISNNAQVTFAQEEIITGRDVIINAIYLQLRALVTEPVTLTFYISSVLFATLVLTPDQFNSLNTNPIQIPVFPTGGTFVAKSPQLQIQIQSQLGTEIDLIRIVKATMFCSIDPNQLPI